MHVGISIKKARKEKRMTLLELSQKSGVALATLSRIENGKMTGTLESHMNIAKALDITLLELYRELPASKKTLEVKAGAAKPAVEVHNKKSSSEMLAPNAANKKMMPVMVCVQKESQTHTEETKPGVEKFIYIVDGKAEVHIGKESYNLTKGDTIYFESSVPHYFKNTGPGELQMIAVTCPPIS